MNDREGLGGRLPLRSVDRLDGDQRATYEKIDRGLAEMARKAGFDVKLGDGRMIGPFNAFLVSPRIGAAYLDLSEVDAKESLLDERLRQVIILAIGTRWQAAYEIYAHIAAARAAGLPDAIVAALGQGHASPDLAAREKVAWRFARALGGDNRVDDALYDEARAAFSERELVDIVMLIGSYLFTSAVLNAFQVPAPE